MPTYYYDDVLSIQVNNIIIFSCGTGSQVALGGVYPSFSTGCVRWSSYHGSPRGCLFIKGPHICSAWLCMCLLYHYIHDLFGKFQCTLQYSDLDFNSFTITFY